ncbi:domain found in dishevelled, Egl-10, and Pleckstrin (DEP) [Rubidibacter lacunae KORDI 51-2]|uniref:Domain found in dishevelled, Egl-10, and Pleckstrin (DEP) n=1 Tax=Rubidibacter lacunae KORDI 51-2 TaxID=582515 RepID=U5DND5_9CHRO|nr:domain found in dishevelled, Egl-10, and Pleckstrin (DEP) [Rubidibacter lacunae]ERN42104.1 domain found in dishevelled, Egl-10, and Pleckstrin (DEP) [Rubidibacter lacunae KORDI 51-2]
MLILEASQLEYCPLVQQVGGTIQVVPGAEYRGRLFIKGETIALHRRDAAVQLSRQHFEAFDGKVYVLLVDDRNAWTLWYQDRTARRGDSNENLVAAIDLKILVAQMRSPTGVSIKSRRYRCRVYPRCFRGSEATAWLKSHLHLSRADALSLGHRLIAEGWMLNVTGVRACEDDRLLYRFYHDE